MTVPSVLSFFFQIEHGGSISRYSYSLKVQFKPQIHAIRIVNDKLLLLLPKFNANVMLLKSKLDSEPKNNLGVI